MIKQSIAGVLAILMINTAFAQLSEHEAQNKAIVLDFYNKAINEKDFPAARVYLGDWYIQHNPGVEDGPQGFEKLIAFIKQKYPETHGTIKRVFAQGNYVILHVFSQRTANDTGRAIVDIFRLENNKIVEHWDVIQAIPTDVKNNNGMF